MGAFAIGALVATVLLAVGALCMIASEVQKANAALTMIGGLMVTKTAGFTIGELRDVSMTALGRISVLITQPGSDDQGDYLLARDGDQIGYGELAQMYEAAITAELRDRGLIG